MRVMALGLDSVPPELFFGRMRAEMPFVSALLERSYWGSLRSCDPPITVPAWMVLACSRSPQRLGLYGFKEREGRSYTRYSLPSSDPTLPTLWRHLGASGARSCILGVPPGFPPPPLEGCSVSCFLTPESGRLACTYPPDLRGTLGLDGDYLFDVPFRREDKTGLLQALSRMTAQKLDLLAKVWRLEPWSFGLCVDIAPDRLHHAFWRHCDPGHPRYEDHAEYSHAFKTYYRELDGRIQGLFSSIDLKDTAVFLVSDHGSKPMRGAFAVNEWLRERGYLRLLEPPRGAAPLEECRVDWKRTRAWAWGGYYGRLFLNLRGREEMGCVPAEAYEPLRRRLADELRGIRGPDGRAWDTQVTLPGPGWAGAPADLHVEFDDLNWRCAATLGHGALYLEDNDTGPDGAVHSRDGILMAHLPGQRAEGQIKGARLLDIAPTVLALLGRRAPREMEGHALL